MRRLKHVLFVLAAVFILLIGTAAPSRAIATDLLITGVIDGPLTGGIPKAVELYVVNDIPDLSIFGLGAANNGGGTDGEEFTFPADSATAGEFIYVATEIPEFTNFFGFAPDYTSGSAASVNGDDAIELFENGSVIDTFGDIDVDGSGEPWEYQDGWAYRVSGTEADGTVFNIANWTFSGPNALDGETSNATAATPFPVGTYMGAAGDAAPSVVSTVPADAATGVAVDANITVNFSEDVTVSGSWFDIACTVSGSVTAVASGGPASYTLTPDADFANDESCTVTVFGAQVTDNDTDDPPDAMAADVSFSFDTEGLNSSSLIINEVDADQSGTDSAEFVELFDGGVGNTDLTGHVLVFFNGSDDASYEAFDLDGLSTDADGYFVLCANAANTPNCDLDVDPDTNLIQNGADAVALLLGDAADFPNDTPVTTVDLLDALVYDTSDSDDAGLLPLLNAGQPQVNEAGAGDATVASNQRCANGSGGARNTNTYEQWAPTPGEENICEIVEPPLSCETPNVATPIYTIQGNGAASALDGTAVIIDGVVVGDFQEDDGDHTDLDGFFVQDVTGDGDASTSDGIFVFAPGAVDVVPGDLVRVSGVVDEYFDMTEITNVDALFVCGTGSVAPTPITIGTDLEPYEGMLVTLDQTVYISEYFNFDRYGEIVLTPDRQFQPTAVFAPGSPDQMALAAANAANRITLDDGRTSQNPDPAIHPNGMEFTLTNTFRGGDSLDNVTGVINYSFDLYRIQPTQGADYTSLNPRTAAPEPVGGSLQVASFNVLNYFNGDGLGGGFPSPRGADDLEEFNRQRDKIIAAIVAMDADVIGLMEIENDGYDALSAIADLVNGLNDATAPGTYAFIDPGVPVIGTDEIAVGLIYKTATVTPYGDSAILDATVDSRFNDDLNRPALAQSFVENSSNGIFTVVVNHLKSKGSACDDFGDPDLGDGAGNCNITRLLAAEAMVDWLATDPTGSGDSDVLIIGDLNSYDKEDPIMAILAGADDTAGSSDDYTDLAFAFGGEFAYSYAFDGQLGYLDYALANSSLVGQVTGVTEWHINADEPDILDYDTSFKQDAQDALYEPNAYRASDHDPVIVGLNLTPSLIQNGDGCYVVALEGSPFTGPANEVLIGDPGYNGFRFHAGRWGRAQGFSNDACYEVHGTDNSEIITGGLEDDLIFGYDGNDYLIGLFGDDTFVGGEGADLINGNNGVDEILDYEPGVDFLFNVELGY